MISLPLYLQRLYTVIMERANTVLQQLQEILNTKNFNSLKGFSDPAKWLKMKPTEKELLARLFILQGEECLRREDRGSKESFENAQKIGGESARLYYLLGKSHVIEECTIAGLGFALESFNRSIELAPSYFDSWYACIEVLVMKGELEKDAECFSEALRLCEQSKELANSQQQTAKASFMWLWGRCLSALAKNSGELIDFYASLEKFQESEELGSQEPEFWKEYAALYSELALLIGRDELHYKAIACYRKALQMVHDYFECWFGLGLCYYFLYEKSCSEEHYAWANSSFENASKICPDEAVLWLKWGQIQAEQSKKIWDLGLLQASLMKFERADKLNPRNPTILCLWGEVEMLLGASGERIDLLREAERKLTIALELEADNDESWHLLGCCLHEIGRYFGEESYFHAAIHKFQLGLSIDSKSDSLWHSMAMSNFAIGDLKSDLALVQKAAQHCSRAIECGGSAHLQCWIDWGVILMRFSEMTNDHTAIEAAIQKFEAAFELQSLINPEAEPDVELLYNSGCAFDSLGEYTNDIACYEKAVQLLSQVLQNDPLHLHARYNLAVALSHLGEVANDVDCFLKALEQFEQLLTLDGEDEMCWAQYGMALLNLALITKDPIVPQKSELYFQDAEAKLMNAVALGCSHAYYPLACLHSLKGCHGAAMHYIQKAKIHSALPPIEDMVHDEWLELLWQTEEFQLFIAELKRSESA